LFWVAFFSWEGFGARVWSNVEPIFPMHILKRRVMAAAFGYVHLPPLVSGLT
jgi:hypothetical protein